MVHGKNNDFSSIILLSFPLFTQDLFCLCGFLLLHVLLLLVLRVKPTFFVQKNKTFLLLLRKVTYKTFSAAAAASAKSAKIQTKRTETVRISETLVEKKRLR